MRRRTYLSTVASGTALAVAGCTGGDDTDDSDDPADDDEESDGNVSDGDEADDGGNNSSDGETDQQLDEPLDVVIENNYDATYTVSVTVTDDADETVFEDEVTLETDTSQRLEDVVSEAGTYTVEATKAEDVSRSFEWEVDADAEDVYVHVAESGEYTIEERDVDA
ncbi:hypothetical protein ACFQDG_15125 [Natronoarchaeum mannanilyticum]|uniref:Ig-like domain-containing protein n=1 Tax=Natronoarchaeum mannanilyticum TaxID=926360 RepID=A0AAV3T9G6_9EURY